MAASAVAAPLLELPPSSGDAPPAPWHVVGLPRQTKPFTRFSVVDVAGGRAVKIVADASYGNLVRPLAPGSAPAFISWRWRIERPLARANLREKSGDDAAAKVCVSFDEPIDKLSLGERIALRYFRAQSKEPVPAATICYVWDSHLAAGTALDNAFTRRMRYLVLESGNQRPDRWAAERRDLGADFKRLFGAESATVPVVVGVAIGADADNTQGHSIAYVADLALDP
jgi:hypothetical protein